jgi:hypothetical protein
MTIRKISQEAIVRDKSKWLATLSIEVSKRVSKEWKHTIYQLPNGLYVVRVPKDKLRPQKSIKKLFWNQSRYTM